MRNRVFLALDTALIVTVVLVAFTARFEGLSWWPSLAPLAIAYMAIEVPTKILLYFSVGLYRRLWRYASIADLEIVLVACLFGAAASFVIGVDIIPAFGLSAHRVPIGILLLDSALSAAAITIPRLLPRVISRRSRLARSRSGALQARAEMQRVLIAGAGDAGGMIARELLDNPQLGLVPIGFMDDDPAKHGHSLHGLPVLGPISMLGHLAHRYIVGEIIIALPSARGKVIRDIAQASAEAGVRARTIPGLYELLSGAKAVSALRPIQIEDLLRREPIDVGVDEVGSLVTGRTVLITGAGGSIGSELCRQLARHAPKQIVAVGRGENSIFELVEELRTTHPALSMKPAIVDVRDEVRLRAVFDQERPFLVFHAAAHKHVPLMEMNIDEAILNNVLGTRNVAELSAEFDVEHLVLISTDKAVRPTSVMGATKRIAEKVIGSVAQKTGKPYVSVRFGNVLGSRGSVVPTFMRQIMAGGPITITHPEMRRYFMTIPEAVRLVLQAATLGRGGEIFVLDMGEPVKIADLAEDLIRLSGLEVGSDIEISFTGIRPGEKLYEELFFGPDDATPTSHPKILRSRDGRPSLDIHRSLDGLIDAARRREPVLELRRMLRGLVPEYNHPSVNRPADQPHIAAPAPGSRASGSVPVAARSSGDQASL